MRAAWALGISAAAHLLALLWLAAKPGVVPEVLPPVAVPIEVMEPAAPSAEPGMSPRPRRRDGPRLSPPRVHQPPAPAEPPSSPVALAEAAPSVSSSPGQPGLPPGRGVDAQGETPSGPGDGSGQGTGSAPAGPPLQLLSARLAEAARACYPPAARRFRSTGAVELSFCAEADGSASRVSLSGSTGSAILDRAAEQCVLFHAQPLPVHEGCFRVPVRFGETAAR